MLLVVCCLVLASCHAQVSSPYAATFGGAGRDVTLKHTVDAYGSVYSVGFSTSNDANATITTPVSSSVASAPIGSPSGSASGFVLKQNAGAPTSVWTVKVRSVVGDASVTAVSVSADASSVFVCGQFYAATLIDGTGAATDLANGWTANTTTDFFVASLSPSTGALLWVQRGSSVGGSSVAANVDDWCTVIATHTFPDGTHSLVVGGVTRVASSSTQLRIPISSSIASVCDPSQSPVCGWTTLTDFTGVTWYTSNIFWDNLVSTIPNALAFDENGHLAIAASLWSDSSSNYWRYGSTSNWDAAILLSSNSTVYSGTFTTYGVSAGVGLVFGSAYDDTPAGIAWLRPYNDVVYDVNSGYTTWLYAPNAPLFGLSGYTDAPAATQFIMKYTGPSTAAATSPFITLSSTNTSWYFTTDSTGSGSATTTAGTALNTAAAQTAHTSAGLALDRTTGTVYVSGTVNGPNGTFAGSFIAPAMKDAFVVALNATTAAPKWVQLIGGASDDAGNSVTYSMVPSLSGVRPLVFVGGAFAGTITLPASALASVSVTSRGSTDGFVAALDEVNDCSASAYNGGNSDPCHLTSNSSAIGGSRCFDGPQAPICFCNMDVNGTYCTDRGWNCASPLQYYYGLLSTCSCPALTNPTGNIVTDTANQLLQCSNSVCSFGGRCLTLVLSLVNTCANSPSTSASDKFALNYFLQSYNACPVSSTGAARASSSSTGYDFSAAPATATVAAAPMLIAALNVLLFTAAAVSSF